MGVLAAIWAKFGHMTKYQIRDYTHDSRNCPEWRDPKGSSYPIHYKTIFEALGFDAELAVTMAAEIQAQDTIAKALHAPLTT